MYFYILIVCLNTITSMINTNPFFDCTDFQEAEVVNTMAQSMFGHNVGVWIGVNDRQIENTYVVDAT